MTLQSVQLKESPQAQELPALGLSMVKPTRAKTPDQMAVPAASRPCSGCQPVIVPKDRPLETGAHARERVAASPARGHLTHRLQVLALSGAPSNARDSGSGGCAARHQVLDQCLGLCIHGSVTAVHRLLHVGDCGE